MLRALAVLGATPRRATVFRPTVVRAATRRATALCAFATLLYVTLLARDALASCPSYTGLGIAETGLGSSGQFVQGKTYVFHLTGNATTSTGNRVTYIASAGFTPVELQLGSNLIVFGAACAGRPTNVSCRQTISGDPAVSDVAFVDLGTHFEVDLETPLHLQGSVAADITVRVDGASGTSVDDVQVDDASNCTGNPFSVAAASNGTAIKPVIISALSGSASPTPIVRGHTSTVTVTASDQDAVATVPSGLTYSLSETVSSVAVPAAQQGVLSGAAPDQRVYTPNNTPRAATVVASVLVQAGPPSTASTTVVVNVQPGAVAQLALSPATAAVSPGQSQTFVASGANAFGGAELVAAADVTFATAPAASATATAAGTVTASTARRTQPESVAVSAALKANNAVKGTATLTILPTVLSSCRVDSDRTELAPADTAVLHLIGVSANGDIDLNAESAFSVDPAAAAALTQSGAVVTLAPRQFGTTVTVTASATVCPGGQAQRVLTFLAPKPGDLVGVVLAPGPHIETVVGGAVVVTAIGHYFQSSDEPLAATWTLSPELTGACSGASCQATARIAGSASITATVGGFTATDVVTIDEGYLSLAWQLSRRQVQQGQAIIATLTATSAATAPHAGVKLSVDLPPGLRLAGPRPQWTIDVPVGAQQTKYTLNLLASARSGTWTLTASGSDPTRATPMATTQAQVVITADPDFAQALLFGRVYDDRNGNGRADEGEPGIANAMVGLSSGRFVFTDADGLYHVPALEPGSVVVKLDPQSLPHVAPLTTRERQVLYLTPGDTVRADFGVALAEPRPPPLRRDLTRAPRLVRRSEGLVYVLPLQSDDKRSVAEIPLAQVRNQIEVATSGVSTGHYKIIVRRYGDIVVADDPVLVRTEFPKVPETRHFLVALGEGVVGFEPQLAKDKQLYWDGKVAFAYRGRIQGKFLISAGVDSSVKDLQNFFQRDPQRIFRNLDPEAYYPVYGDGSRLEDEREGGGRLYVRVEMGKSYAKWGSFRTQLSDTEYGRYDRALYGAAIRFVQETPNGPAHKVIVFFAQPDSDRVHDELYGTGTTLYYLSRTSLVEGSEQLFVERRQQVTGQLRERTLLAPGKDYVIDYLAGRILLNKPLLSTVSSDSALRQGAQDGDEQWLLADYEVQRDLGAKNQSNVVGGRAVERPFRGLEIGVTGAGEVRPGPDYWMVGGDLNFHRWEPFQLHAEYTHSASSLLSRTRSFDGGLDYQALPDLTVKGGDAYAGRASFHWGELKAEAYGKLRTSGFNDTTTAPGERLEQLGGAVRDKFWFGLTAAVSFDDTRRDGNQGASIASGELLPSLRLARDLAELELAQNIGPVTLLAGARYGIIPAGYGVGQEAVVAGGVVWHIVPQLAIGVTHQQPVYRTGDRLFDSLGRDTQGIVRWQITDKWAVDGGGGYGERGASGRAAVSFPFWGDAQGSLGFMHGGALISDALSVGVKRQIGDGTLAFADNQFSASAQGRYNTISGGIEQSLGKHHLFSLNYETGQRLVGLALGESVERMGGGIGYAYVGERVQLRSRLEARLDAGNTTLQTPGQKMIGGQLRIDWKATERLSLAAWTKTNFASQLVHHNQPESDYSENAIGLALRPLETERFTVFARYAFIRERLPREQNASGSYTESHIATAAALIDPWRWAGFMAKVAGKIGDLVVPYVGKTDLLSLLTIARVNGHITKVWDASAEYRLCMDKGVGLKNGALFEVSALLAGYVRLGAGYNFSSISDVTVDCQAQDARGFFVRAQAMY